MPSTTTENLYNVLCEVITRTTGYPAWSKSGIQSMPTGPYAVAYLSEAANPATQDVVEVRALSIPGPNGETLQEVPWNAVRLDCVVEFYRGNAMLAANQFKSGLQLSNRDFDLNAIAGLCGPIRAIDVSAVFRADTEARAQTRFCLYANVTLPLPLDASIFEIDHQPVSIVPTAPPVTINITVDAPL